MEMEELYTDINLFIDYDLAKDKWINAQKQSIKNTFWTTFLFS
jgi:hypothetical protein